MKVVIHAPTSNALRRARVDALSLTDANPDGTVRILANGDGVSLVADEPHPETDHLLIVCEMSLARRDLNVLPPIETTPIGSYMLGRLQKKGWIYMRA